MAKWSTGEKSRNLSEWEHCFSLSVYWQVPRIEVCFQEGVLESKLSKQERQRTPVDPHVKVMIKCFKGHQAEF